MKKFVILIIAILYSFNFTFAETQCWKTYCWNNEQEMFLKAEQAFNDDYKKGLHPAAKGTNIKCDYNLASVAYGFANAETKLGTKGIGRFSNWYGMKKGSGTYQPKWKEEMGLTNGHLVYPSPFLATYDFMYLIKYAYKCNLSKENLLRYVGWQNNKYYFNVMSSVQFFERNFENIKKAISLNPALLPEPKKEETPTLDELSRGGSSDIESPSDLYFSNKGLNIIMKNVKDAFVVTYPDRIQVESKYSNNILKINYKSCSNYTKEYCESLEKTISSTASDKIKSNGITYYKVGKDRNDWIFFRSEKYIYYMYDIEKSNLTKFSKNIYMPAYMNYDD